MTDEFDPKRCQYVCPRKQRQCKMFPSTDLSTHCMEHLLHDPNLDEVILSLIDRLRNTFYYPLDNETNITNSMSIESSSFNCSS